MVWFIGDVHGWIDRLERVLEQIDGPMVFLGDLIDRGSQSQAVVARVRELVTAGCARVVMGNHEFALVRGLGCVERGLGPDLDLYDSWLLYYGGEATCQSYGVPDGDPEKMVAALGDDLVWMADLPWLLEGAENKPGGGTAGWLAAHAGLDADSALSLQRDELNRPDPRYWVDGAPLPAELYSKARTGARPFDCPADVTIVSGHVPYVEAEVSPGIICCDTSGGQPHRHLSAVSWPDGRVVTG